MTVPNLRTSYLLFRVLAAVLAPQPLVDQAVPGGVHESPLELAQRHDALTGGGLYDPNGATPFADAGSRGADDTVTGRPW
jgi:hypothetical protein